jgi:probable phosphoglycerate mutase
MHRIQGWVDSPLTYQGERQSIKGGLSISQVEFDAIYTSDMQRTIRTAEKALSVNKRSECILQPAMPEFREFHFGEFEGLEAKPVWQAVYQTIGKRNNDLQVLLDAFYALDTTQTAEDYKRFAERIEVGLDKVIEKHAIEKEEGSNVLIVTHALTISYIMQSLFPEDTEFVIGKNGSIRKVAVEDGKYSLVI